jgi:hypothetical protein
MATDRFVRIVRLTSWSLLAIPLAGCGGDEPSGVYLPKHPDSPITFIEKFDFQSGGKVAVTAMGNTSVGELVITDDGNMRIIMPEGHSAHLRDGGDGCLVGVVDPGLAAAAAEDGVDLEEMSRYCPE